METLERIAPLGFTPLTSSIRGEVLKYDFAGAGPRVLDKSGHLNGGMLKPNWPKNAPKRRIVSLFPPNVVLRFDGVDDYLVARDSPSLSALSAFTIFVRFKMDELPSRAGRVFNVISKGTQPAYIGEWFITITRDDRFNIGVVEDGRTKTVIKSPSALAENTWYSIKGTFSDETDTLKASQDGEEVGEKVARETIQDTSHNVFIGYDAVQEGRQFKGEIGEIRIQRTVRVNADGKTEQL